MNWSKSAFNGFLNRAMDNQHEGRPQQICVWKLLENLMTESPSPLTVRDIIKQLEDFDPDAPVYVGTYEEGKSHCGVDITDIVKIPLSDPSVPVRPLLVIGDFFKRETGSTFRPA